MLAARSWRRIAAELWSPSVAGRQSRQRPERRTAACTAACVPAAPADQPGDRRARRWQMPQSAFLARPRARAETGAGSVAGAGIAPSASGTSRSISSGIRKSSTNGRWAMRSYANARTQISECPGRSSCLLSL